MTLRIESPAFGGDGIGRLDGKVYFVADALPDQVLLVRVTEDKERFAKAVITEIIEEAAYAIPPPCIYAKRCGGCQWQKVPYSLQLTWKANFIRDALQRIGGMPPDTYKFAFHGSPKPYAYRNRINLKCEIETGGEVKVGYFSRSSHDLISINSCSIADPEINTALASLNSLKVLTREKKFSGRLELQVITTNGLAQLALYAEEWPKDLWQQLAFAIQDNPVLSARISIDSKDFVLLERWSGIDYFTKAGQFQQVNLSANHFLRQWVRDTVRDLKAEIIVDLYCGSGNLSLALAKDGRQVYGIEAFAPSIAVATFNQQHNQLSQAIYKTGEAADIQQVFPKLQGVDLAIVDPPRRGMAEALGPLIKLRAKHLIYVSCDPNTLARDLKSLAKAGYYLDTAIGLDFFPQSYHVETACLLHLR